MKPKFAWISAAGILLALILAGCSQNVTAVPTTAPSPTAAPTQAPSATATLAPTATPTLQPTATNPPTATPTQTLVPSPTATVSPLLAASTKLDVKTAGNLKLQAQWGLGAIKSQISLQNGRLVLAQTALGQYLYEMQPLKLVQFFPNAGSIHFSDDEHWMVYADSTQIGIYDLLNTKPYKSLTGSPALTAAAFSADNQFLAVVHSSTDINVIRKDDLSSVALTRDRTATYEPVTYAAAFSPDDQFLLTRENGGLVMWNIKEQKLAWYLKNFNQSIPQKPFSPDGSFFLTYDRNNSTLRDARFGTELFTVLGLPAYTSYSPDGKLFFLMNKQVVTVYTLGKFPGVVRNLMLEGPGGVYFSDDSTKLVAGNKVLNLADFKITANEKAPAIYAQISPAQALQLGHFANLKGFASGKQGELWAWGVLDRQIFLWETVSGTVQSAEIAGKRFLANLVYNAGGQQFAACTDKGLEIINMKDGSHKLFSGCMPNGQVAFSPDGSMIARAALTRIELLNSADGSMIYMMPEHTIDINHVVFSADGKWLAVGTIKNMQNGYCEVSLWHLDPFALVSGFRGKQIPGGVNGLAVTADGQWLVGLTNMLRLWRTADSEQMKYTETYGSALALSPDGSLAAVANAGSISLSSVPDFNPVGSVSGSSGNILSLGFTENGANLIMIDSNGLVRLWAVPCT